MDGLKKKQRAEGTKMPRTRRLIINDETAVYHVMSRTALDGFPLGDVEPQLNALRASSAKN